MGHDTIRCTKTTKQILAQRSNNTGLSIPQLLELAVRNMPYIPPEQIKRK
mgnify:CR=1 FL=1